MENVVVLDYAEMLGHNPHFADVKCVLFEQGLCDRPHCPFRHEVRDDRNDCE